MNGNRSAARRLVVTLVALGALTVAGHAGAAADWKPSKPVQFVVPYGPGGGSDILARTISSIVQGMKLNPTPLVVVNQAGGSGMIGTTAVAQAPGNEHMLITFIPGQVAGPLAAGKGAATYRDLTLIGAMAIDENLLVVKMDSPFKTIEDVVAAAKARPGAITIGGTATGQEDHMCNRLFERAAGVKTRFVPFNAGAEVVTAVLGGHTDVAWANPSEFFAQYEAKLIRPLVIAKETRIAKFSDVPTFKEKGYDVVFKMFRGVAAPGKLSPAVVAYYEDVMKRVANSPAWKEKYLEQYMLSPGWMSSKDFSRFVADSEGQYKAVLTELELLK